MIESYLTSYIPDRFVMSSLFAYHVVLELSRLLTNVVKLLIVTLRLPNEEQ